MPRPAEQHLRLHLINALFHEVTGKDAYLAGQIKSAIERSVDPSLPPQLQSEQFFRAAEKLLSRFFRRRSTAHGFAFWNAASGLAGFQPLLAHQELLALFRKLSSHPRSTVVIGNLRSAICPGGRRWSASRQLEYAEAIGYIEDAAQSASRRHANLTLLFL